MAQAARGGGRSSPGGRAAGWRAGAGRGACWPRRRPGTGGPGHCPLVLGRGPFRPGTRSPSRGTPRGPASTGARGGLPSTVFGAGEGSKDRRAGGEGGGGGAPRVSSPAALPGLFPAARPPRHPRPACPPPPGPRPPATPACAPGTPARCPRPAGAPGLAQTRGLWIGRARGAQRVCCGLPCGAEWCLRAGHGGTWGCALSCDCRETWAWTFPGELAVLSGYMQQLAAQHLRCAGVVPRPVPQGATAEPAALYW